MLSFANFKSMMGFSNHTPSQNTLFECLEHRVNALIKELQSNDAMSHNQMLAVLKGNREMNLLSNAAIDATPYKPKSLLKATLSSGNFLHIYTNKVGCIEMLEYSEDYKIISTRDCLELTNEDICGKNLKNIQFIAHELKLQFPHVLNTVARSHPEVIYEFHANKLLESKRSVMGKMSNTLDELAFYKDVGFSDAFISLAHSDEYYSPDIRLRFLDIERTVILYREFLTKPILEGLAQDHLSAYREIFQHIETSFREVEKEIRFLEELESVAKKYRRTFSAVVDELPDSPALKAAAKILLFFDNVSGDEMLKRQNKYN